MADATERYELEMLISDLGRVERRLILFGLFENANVIAIVRRNLAVHVKALTPTKEG